MQYFTAGAASSKIVSQPVHAAQLGSGHSAHKCMCSMTL